jgi:tRNA threonylcarbamoyladenosine biosynthesis protein TsaB
MLILALDAAGAACSVAIGDSATLRAYAMQTLAQGHGEILMPMIVAAMAEAGVGYSDLDRIAVTVGPGGFTGVRIGLATARGIALAAGRPVVGITSFAAVAAAVPAPEQKGRTLVVALESKRAELFLQVFGAGSAPLGEPRLLAPEAAAAELPDGSLLIAGDGAGRLASALPAGRFVTSRITHADARSLLELAERAESGMRPPSALYLRPPEAKPATQTRRG